MISTLALASVGIGIALLSEEESKRLHWLEMLDLAIVAFFWVDFGREMQRQGQGRAYLASHWWELPSLIPTIPALVDVFPGFALLRVVR